MRKFLLTLFVLAALLFGGFLGIRDADVSLETLTGRYGQAPSQFVTLPSGLIAHYRDQGNLQGPVLVLLHGSNASLYTWEPWARSELAATYRIISVDLIGHGLSSLSPGHDYSQAVWEGFVEEFVGTLGLTRFTLAGNSMGGGIAWRYALSHGDELDALVLVDASGIPHPHAEAEEAEEALVYRIARMPVLNKLLLHILPRSMIEEQLLSAVAKDEVITEEMVTRYHAFLLREGRREATMARMNQGREPSPVDRLSEIKTPTLILWGSEDTWVPVHGAHVYDAQIPASTLILYEGVGHIPMEEVSARSAADLAAFLKSLAPRPGSE